MDSASEMAQVTTQGASQVRARIRQGLWTSHTSGLADEHVQGNVAITTARPVPFAHTYD